MSLGFIHFTGKQTGMTGVTQKPAGLAHVMGGGLSVGVHGVRTADPSSSQGQGSA